MTTDHDNQLTKIRALLAKAEHEATPKHEAEALTAKAAELMAKYGIDRAMLAAADPTSDAPGDRIVPVDAPYALDKAQLLGNVAESLRCRAIIRTRHPGGRKQISVHLFGYGSDLERVEMLYTSLLIQATNAIIQTPVPAYEHAAAFRRSFLNGFTAAIADRLEAAEKRAEQQAERARMDGPSTALVLADRTAVVNKHVAETYPKLRSGKRRLSGGGYSEGMDAGRRADLGGTRVNPGGRRALGGGR